MRDHTRGRRAWRTALIAVEALLIASCSESAELAESRTWSDLPFIAMDTVLVTGGAAAEGAAAFGAVSDAEVLSDPLRLAVADRASREIRVFDLEGRHLRSLGGAGSGPGEFSGNISAIVALDMGRLGAWDAGQRRLTVFTPDGLVERVARPDLTGLSGAPSFVGAFPDGRFVLRLEPSLAQYRGSRPEGLVADTTRFASFELDGSRGALDLEIERPPQWWYDRENGYGHLPLIFGRTLRGFVSGAHFLTGPTDAVALDQYDAAGNLVGAVDLGTFPRPLTAEVVSAERERRVASAGGPVVYLADGTTVNMAVVIGGIVRGLDAYDTSPIFDEVQAGGDGTVWIRAVSITDGPTRQWVMIDRDGEVRGQVVLPSSAAVVGGGASHTVVATEDEFEATVLIVMRPRF